MDKIQRIKELVSTLNKHRDFYYNKNESLISDSEYDKMFDELQALEKETMFILSNSPTQSVGYSVVKELNEVEHKTPLLSLDKTKSVDDIVKFSKGEELIEMLKLDGLTVELEYNEGKFIKGSTRGDGMVGEDITHNIPMFKNIPLSIPETDYVRLSGEAVIHQNDFTKINDNLTEDEKKRLPKGKYSTCRNLVSGSVRQLNNQICANREVHFYGFNVLEFKVELVSKAIELEWIKSQGFDAVDYVRINYNANSKEIDEAILKLSTLAAKKYLPIDGIVFTFNNLKYGKSLGVTSHHPLHSMAFKFKDETEDTTLRDIEWSMGRTGVLTPVAIFDSVELDGTEVSRASLHNISIIEKLELGIGDTVSIAKMNMIIPQIVKNKTKSNNLVIPNICPECGHTANIFQKIDSKVLKCLNPYCKGKLISKFSHFVSKKSMNIDGLSESTLEKFINKGWLKIFSDIYKLDKYKDELINMEGMGQRSYIKLWDAIQESRNVKLENFLVALGINNIGKTASKTLSKHFGSSWYNIEAALNDGFDFTKLKDFGSTMQDSLYDWYCSDEYYELENLMPYLNFIVPQEKQETGLKNLSGLTFVITGSVNTFKNRDEFKELVESLNGSVSGSVSKNTDYLVNNDVNSTTGKNKKAKDLDVPIISEEQFNDMIGRNV